MNTVRFSAIATFDSDRSAEKVFDYLKKTQRGSFARNEATVYTGDHALILNATLQTLPHSGKIDFLA